MAYSSKSDWLIPVGLIALSVIPVVAGTIRIADLSVGAEITPDNARFFAAPWLVVFHILSSAIYCVLGAFQFSPGVRRSKPDWHRAAGRILIPCGLIVALSGLWMTQFYPTGVEPPASFDGPFLYAIRLLVGSAMAVFLWLGFAAVKRRDIPRYRVWMMRAYAIGLGAGSQVFTHIPWFMFPSIHGELARTLLMGAGWAINLAVAEWLILRERRKKQSGNQSQQEHRNTNT
jgi:uncharacterized membrane protein